MLSEVQLQRGGQCDVYMGRPEIGGSYDEGIFFSVDCIVFARNVKFPGKRVSTLDDAGLKEMLEDLQKLPEQVELVVE